MIFFITADSDWEARLGKILSELNGLGYETFFSKKKYGDSVDGITIVYMCQPSDLGLRQRVNFVKKEKHFYLDIMLDLEQFRQISHVERKTIMINKLIDELPIHIAEKKFSDFDIKKFIVDLKKCFLD